MKFNVFVFQRSRIANIKIKLVALTYYGWKKIIFEEIVSNLKTYFFRLICADMIFKTVRGFLFLNKWVLRYLNFGNFRVLKNKIVLHNKIINQTRSTKNQEHFAHSFGDNYLTNHLVKCLHDRIKP